MTEQRARRGFFTVSVIGAGGEHKLQAVNGFEHGVELIDPVSESTRIDQFALPAQYNMGDLTFRESPFAGCGGQPAANFYFRVLLNGTEIAHTRSITGLGIHWDVMTNQESTSLNTQKLWNKRSVPEITLNQVIELSEGNPLYTEISKLGTFQGPGKAYSVVGGAVCAYRGDWTIVLMMRDGSEVARWTVYGCFPSRYTPINDLEATATDVGMRSLTLRSSPATGIQNIEETISSAPGGDQLYSQAWADWITQAFKVPQRKDLALNLYAPESLPGVGAPVKRWKLFNCWPSQINYQDLDASSPSLATREIVVAYDGYVEV